MTIGKEGEAIKSCLRPAFQTLSVFIKHSRATQSFSAWMTWLYLWNAGLRRARSVVVTLCCDAQSQRLSKPRKLPVTTVNTIKKECRSRADQNEIVCLHVMRASATFFSDASGGQILIGPPIQLNSLTSIMIINSCTNFHFANWCIFERKYHFLINSKEIIEIKILWKLEEMENVFLCMTTWS